MESLPFERIGIAGLGLIGGSLARALAARRPGLRISAFDPLPAAGAAVRAAGAVRALAPDLDALLEAFGPCRAVPAGAGAAVGLGAHASGPRAVAGAA